MKKLFLIVTMLLSPFQFQARTDAPKLKQSIIKSVDCGSDSSRNDEDDDVDDSEVGGVICGVVGGQLVIIIGASLAEIAVAPIMLPLGIAGVAIVSGKVGYDYALGRYEILDEPTIKKQAGKKACEEIKKAFAELGNDDTYRKLKTISTTIDCDKEYPENDADIKVTDKVDISATIVDGKINISYAGKKFDFISVGPLAADKIITALNKIAEKDAVDNIKIYRQCNPVDTK